MRAVVAVLGAAVGAAVVGAAVVGLGGCSSPPKIEATAVTVATVATVEPKAEPGSVAEPEREVSAAAQPILSLLARLEVDTEIRLAPIATGQTEAELTSTAVTDVSAMEWHGNPVGDRWRVASLGACVPCEGFNFLGADLLDGRVFRVDVTLAEPPPWPRERPAAEVCAEIRADVVGDRRVSAGPCACRAHRAQDEISTWALPEGPRRQRACDPTKESAFPFEIVVPGAKHRIPRVTGAVALTTEGRVLMRLTFYGSHYRRLLEAKAARKHGVAPP